ncbi:MAG: ABC transporter ATP-binding protein [FCB group bacterium]|nr:ABC transporter ATP-binding protein [FCB group bacterium]
MAELALQIRHLTKSFKGRRAVDDLSFTVAQGEVFGFLGPNGAGKSTTIRIMVSLLKPDDGDIFIFGQSVAIHRNSVLKDVGALIERPDFYLNLSARQNLNMLAGMEAIPLEQVDEVLRIVSLQDRAGDRVKTFSHGMKQRLGIAQALLGHPKLLVLDEPTNGLDPQGMKEIRDLVRDLSDRGMTIFLSSHLLDEVEKVCTSMAILHQGRLVTTGTVNDVLNQAQQRIVELEVHPIEQAETLLSSRKDCREITRDGHILRLQADPENLPAINRALVEANIDVRAMIPQHSLEDVFLSLIEDEG